MKETPCKGCTERFTACWGKCPKDKRGEYGYEAWLADTHKEQAALKELKYRNREAFRRSEECAWINKKRSYR